MRSRVAAPVAARPAGQRLDRTDFDQPTLRVARDLLGKFIVHDLGSVRIAAMIAETEAYKGPRDRASHAYGGRRTRRVEPLYRHGGTVYVYFVYGMHWMLNFSTAGAERPEGVLIRAVVESSAGAAALVAGPGRVTRHLRIDGSRDGIDAAASRELWVEDRGVRVPARAVTRSPRVGVDYAGAYWAARPWRFMLAAQVFGAARPSPTPTLRAPS